MGLPSRKVKKMKNISALIGLGIVLLAGLGAAAVHPVPALFQDTACEPNDCPGTYFSNTSGTFDIRCDKGANCLPENDCKPKEVAQNKKTCNCGTGAPSETICRLWWSGGTDGQEGTPAKWWSRGATNPRCTNQGTCGTGTCKEVSATGGGKCCKCQ